MIKFFFKVKENLFTPWDPVLLIIAERVPKKSRFSIPKDRGKGSIGDVTESPQVQPKDRLPALPLGCI